MMKWKTGVKQEMLRALLVLSILACCVMPAMAAGSMDFIPTFEELKKAIYVFSTGVVLIVGGAIMESVEFHLISVVSWLIGLVAMLVAAIMLVLAFIL